ncbi:McrC family protein [Runella sp.]|uniref:McrC family protein n=1 Tax=Runella sp. TaxID=1960881 RepID=UPI003D12B3CE
MQAINLFEFDKYEKLSNTELVPGLKSYLEEVWESRKRYGAIVDEDDEIDEVSEEEEAVWKRNKQRFLLFDGTFIRARNYVGFIQYEGVRINIYPKICKGIPQNKILPQVLYWLGYSKRVSFPFAQVPLSYETFDNWLEAFIFLFAHYSEETLSSQPYQAYQEITEETAFLRGRLAISQYIQANVITGRQQFFHCTYEPFVYDNQFNRIVKFVTRLLLSVSQSKANTDKLHELLFLLDEVSDIHCQTPDCDLVKLNPLYQDLSVILEMCRLFLSSSTVNQHDFSNANFCFLLPMEVIFEDFIFGFVEKYFPTRKPKAQAKSYLALNKNKDKVFDIKNDIILEAPCLIIDTKYKIRNVDGNKKGIAQSDMYQVLAYAIRRNIDQVLLIYPKVNDIETFRDEFTIELSSENNHKVCVEAMDVDVNTRDEEAIKKQLNLN